MKYLKARITNNSKSKSTELLTMSIAIINVVAKKVSIEKRVGQKEVILLIKESMEETLKTIV